MKKTLKMTALMLCTVLVCGTVLLSGCGASDQGIPNAVADSDTVSAEDGPNTPDSGSTSEIPVADDATDDANATGSQDEADEIAAEGDETDDSSDTDDAKESSEQEDEPKMSDGITIPELNVPSLKVPENETNEFLKKMGVGFNLGNTFDAYSDPTPADEMTTETCWHHTLTTQQMIKDIHAYGFDTIRIPVSWHNHVDADYNISEQWLDRVNEVADWAIDEGMYVIINIHHDNHPEANALYPDSEHLDRSKKYVGRIWEQVSERFKDYDEHLIFEAMNEPRLVGSEFEWDFRSGNKVCRDAIDCINTLNQLFVDTVRSSGGNNATRYLMCPGYAASMDGGTNPFFELPQDIEGNEAKIILSIHAYTPYNFALEYPGVSDFDVDNKSRTTDINTFMNKLYMDYVMQGIPVVIGEFGSRDKNGNLQDRVNYSAYFVCMSRARNIPCILWDNNEFSGSGEIFGVYNRKDPDASVKDIIYALMKYK